MATGQTNQIPEFVNCILIDRSNNNKQSHLPHVHENELELFYVYAGTGQYMVDNRLYPIRAGDIVVCNAGVLHGEEPSLVRQIHSYSIAMTGVQFEGLPPNCLIDSYTNPVVSCGQLAGHVGQLMQLIYMLSADTAHLGELVRQPCLFHAAADAGALKQPRAERGNRRDGATLCAGAPGAAVSG